MNIDKKTGLTHEWSLLCRSSAIDKDSNALSLFNVIDRVTINKEQFEKHAEEQPDKDFIIPIDYEFVSLWSKEGGEAVSVEIKTEAFDPKGSPLFKFSYNLYLKEGRTKQRNRSKVKGFKITEEGRYSLAISVRKDEGEEYRHIVSIPLDVLIRSPQKPDAQ